MTRLESVAPPADPEILASEVGNLPRERFLARNGPLSVLLAEAGEIPHVLFEIGRLREITFRAAGEGTGGVIDLDWFDGHYSHLVLWNGDREEVVGAYRVGPTDAILPRFGADGLYTSTLFEYEPGFFDRLGPALELGRSFVRPEYQRSYAALLLLWKGIGRFVVRRPRYRNLFGAVSVSHDYSAESREQLVRFLTERHFLPALARFVRPKLPVGFDEARARRVADVDELGRVIGEREGRAVPILLRQYLKLGGRLLGFNRDPAFGDCLDGLLLVDLLEAPPGAIDRFFGAAGMATFRECHGRRPGGRSSPLEAAV